MKVKELEIMEYLAKAYRLQRSLFNSELDKYDITAGTYPFILTINRFPGISLIEISKEIAIDRGTTTKYVNKLIKNGVLYKIPCQKDKRVYHMFLTDKGRDISKIISKEVYNIADLLEVGLTKEEVEITSSTLKKIYNNFKKAAK